MHLDVPNGRTLVGGIRDIGGMSGAKLLMTFKGVIGADRPAHLHQYLTF